MLYLYKVDMESVQRRATDWTARFQFSTGHDFCLLQTDQSCSGSHPASYPMSTGRKAPGAIHLKNGGAAPPLSHTSSWHSAQFTKHGDNFTSTVSITFTAMGIPCTPCGASSRFRWLCWVFLFQMMYAVPCK
jgi:hypothetical protein